jgi:peptidoglycan/LPS O-acetylase OafA/YrhL
MLNVDDLADTAYQGLQPRADIFLVLGVLGLIAAVLVLRAIGWARIVLCVLGVVVIGLAAVDLGDLSPGTLHALDAVMSICVLAAIVCQWLPGSNAAVRDRKAAR